jgi:hypothetical protein
VTCPRPTTGTALSRIYAGVPTKPYIAAITNQVQEQAAVSAGMKPCANSHGGRETSDTLANYVLRGCRQPTSYARFWAKHGPATRCRFD